MPLSVKDTIQGTITNAQNAATVNGHTVNSDVPSEAKFTDTWRGVQNNLTSTETDQSLSAAQGKVLKSLIDGKAASSHTHTKSQITDFPSSLPASDVYAWAKASTKPSYTKSEVGLGNVDNTADSAKSVKYATNAGSANAVAWNNVSGKPSTYTPSSHDHSMITTIGDTRNTATKPNDYSNSLTFCGLKSNSVIDNPSSNTYSYLFGLRGWEESSGGNAYEIAFNDTGVYVRSGESTTWGSWQRIYTTGFKPSKADVGLGSVDNTADSAKSVNYANSAGAVAWGNVTDKPSTFAPSSHTHPYAGAASSGGSATSAVKLDTSTAGSATQPVYFTGGKPTACIYTLGKSVPSNAVFTDTTYGDATTSAHGLMTAADKSKLNGIATGANKTVVDSTISQSSTNPVQNGVITKRLQFLYSFKISRDKWNEASDKSNWNVIVSWTNSSGTALTGSTTGTPNLTTGMSLGPAMMERTSSLSDNIILSGELSMINQGQIFVCETNKLSFTVKRRPVCDLMLYFYARQWTT